MKELIKITNEEGSNRQLVNARELWKVLESKRKFADWVKAKVVENAFFEENVDWVVYNICGENPLGGRPSKDYTLTLRCAKLMIWGDAAPKAPDVYKYLCSVNGKDVVIVRPERKEIIFGFDIIDNLFSEYMIIPQFPVFGGKYRIDWYIPELKIAIEYDEIDHASNYEKDMKRQLKIEKELGCRFLRFTEQYKPEKEEK